MTKIAYSDYGINGVFDSYKDLIIYLGSTTLMQDLQIVEISMLNMKVEFEFRHGTSSRNPFWELFITNR